VFDDKLPSLRRQIIEYANHVEDMIDKSIKGLLEHDSDLLRKLIEIDESKANETEIILDELCAATIAQYEPRARELRTVLMALKMNNDLERVADHAVNISQSALFLINRPAVKPFIDIPRMAEIAVKMLKDSIASFINEDAALARDVCERDSIVDSLDAQILMELITFMMSDAKTIERSIHLLNIARNLERIADLSTNICEDVIYMVEGKVIKHHNVEAE
jgi:phosphate transport system protein